MNLLAKMDSEVVINLYGEKHFSISPVLLVRQNTTSEDVISCSGKFQWLLFSFIENTITQLIQEKTLIYT